MSTALQSLSEHNLESLPSAVKMRFGIVVSEWNPEITSALLTGTLQTLESKGAKKKNLLVKHVPGSFELTSGAQYLAEYSEVDAIICLGCVIQGETKHFDFICDAVANGLTNVSLKYKLPVIFGVLTTNDLLQARERSGGKHGNKGIEAAVTAIKMAALKASFRS